MKYRGYSKRLVMRSHQAFSLQLPLVLEPHLNRSRRDLLALRVSAQPSRDFLPVHDVGAPGIEDEYVSEVLHMPCLEIGPRPTHTHHAFSYCFCCKGTRTECELLTIPESVQCAGTHSHMSNVI